jgi:hypothetical protein
MECHKYDKLMGQKIGQEKKKIQTKSIFTDIARNYFQCLSKADAESIVRDTFKTIYQSDTEFRIVKSRSMDEDILTVGGQSSGFVSDKSMLKQLSQSQLTRESHAIKNQQAFTNSKSEFTRPTSPNMKQQKQQICQGTKRKKDNSMSQTSHYQ